jgi:hypothetical protein
MTQPEWLAGTDPAAMFDFLVYRSHPDMPWFVTPSDRKLRLFACACCRQVWHQLTDERSRATVELAERLADGEAPTDEEWQQTTGIDMGDAVARGAWSTGLVGARDAAVQASGELSGVLPSDRRASLLHDIIGNPFRPVTLGQYDHPSDPVGVRIAPPWLTPQVLTLAQAAYEERPGRECAACSGVGQYHQIKQLSGERAWMVCPECGGTGRIEDGTLDPVRLAILADGLEEAGCVGEVCMACDGRGSKRYADMEDEEPDAVCLTCKGGRRLPSPLLAHLRSPGPHVRGCWAVDLTLGKEGA